MSELRKDPVIGRWVIIATQRARRPGNIVDPDDNKIKEDPCPYCAGRESKTDHEIFALRIRNSFPNKNGWQVRVIPSLKPVLNLEGELKRSKRHLHDVMNGVGAHEVVVETPEHIANMADLSVDQIKFVLKAYGVRLNDLYKDERLKYVMIYKNYGWSAGGSKVRHSISQIVATPVNPMRVKEELKGAKNFFDLNHECLYCKLIEEERALGKRLILEDKHFIVVTPFASRFPFEVWILPKKHGCDFAKGVSGLEEDLAKILKKVLMKIKVGLNDPAYNYVIHSAPFRRTKVEELRWSTVDSDYHWHMEIMPRLTHVAGFEKGAGFYICPIPPEDTADFLRNIEV